METKRTRPITVTMNEWMTCAKNVQPMPRQFKQNYADHQSTEAPSLDLPRIYLLHILQTYANVPPTNKSCITLK